MPRIDMILIDMIDEVTYAKRTLILQHTFNQMSILTNSNHLE